MILFSENLVVKLFRVFETSETSIEGDIWNKYTDQLIKVIEENVSEVISSGIRGVSQFGLKVNGSTQRYFQFGSSEDRQKNSNLYWNEFFKIREGIENKRFDTTRLNLKNQFLRMDFKREFKALGC